MKTEHITIHKPGVPYFPGRNCKFLPKPGNAPAPGTGTAAAPSAPAPEVPQKQTKETK